jgi:hypothetical protein
MNKFIFFLMIIPILIMVPNAYAEIEHGFNYDRELIGVTENNESIHRWTNTAERIIDYYDGTGKPVYINFKTWEDESNIYFESFGKSYVFDKDSNSFNVHEGGKLIDNPQKLKLHHILTEAINETDNWNDVTLDTPHETITNHNEFGIQIISKQNSFETIYDIDYRKGFEYTYRYTNNDVLKTDHKYGFKSICDGIECDALEIDDKFIFNNEVRTKPDFDKKKIKIGKGIFDLKEETHDATWAISKQPNKITIDFTDSKGKLNVGETLEVDPTFNYAGAGDSWRGWSTSSSNSVCNTTLSSSNFDTDGSVGGHADSGNGFCSVVGVRWDISSIPAGASISNTLLRLDTEIGTSHDLDITQVDEDILTGSAANIWDDVVGIGGDSSVVVYYDAWNVVTETNRVLDMGVTADSYIEDTSLGVGFFQLGFIHDNGGTWTRSGASDFFKVCDSGGGFSNSNCELEITYSTTPNPDAVDDLTSTDIGVTTVDLSWTEPNLQTGNLSGYRISYGTPHTDSPSVIITNNTESSDVTTQVSGLSELTQYSFQIGVWTEGSNMTGNILNVTTVEDFTLANYTAGFFDVNATNTDIIQMFFERQDINSTSLFLNVTYPNTYSLACDFSYQFANVNQTYNGLSTTVISANTVESSFQFNDVDNEIIDVYCYDESNLNNDGSYIITQTSFPLLDQISNFRNGTYGTQGDFGAIDLVTLAVVLVSMIGFNRINESVGAIFNIILLGSFAYFEIIELPTIIFGAIAVVLMLVVASTRKT